MLHLFIDILIVLIMCLLFLFVYSKQKKCKIVYNNLYNFINKNIDFLTEIHHKQIANELQNSIKIYSKFQVIQKISKSDYLSFFKFDSNLNFNYLFLIDNKGNIVQHSNFDKFIITEELKKSKVIKNNSEELLCIELNNINENENFDNISSIIKSRELNKFYYKNLFNEKTTGFFVLSYKDKEFVLDEDDKFEILRILENIKKLL